MLESPAAAAELKPDERSAALSLAHAYRDLTAVSDVDAADSVMKKLCGAG